MHWYNDNIEWNIRETGNPIIYWWNWMKYKWLQWYRERKSIDILISDCWFSAGREKTEEKTNYYCFMYIIMYVQCTIVLRHVLRYYMRFSFTYKQHTTGSSTVCFIPTTCSASKFNILPVVLYVSYLPRTCSASKFNVQCTGVLLMYC